MSFSRSETRLAAITGVVLLGFFGYMLIKPKYTAWQNQRARVAQIKDVIAESQSEAELVPVREAELEELMEALPVHPEGANVVSDMMRSIERHSANSGLTVRSVYPDKERKDPERNLYEFSIRCDWEGELGPLSKFLYSLQSQGAVMDVSLLNIKPSRTQGVLDGKLTIDFAYRRVAVADIPAAPASVETAEEEGLRVTPTP